MKIVLHDDQCRYLKQADRITLWGEPIPDGMVLGHSCAVPYCRHREHMVLRGDKTVSHRDYTGIKKKVAALKEGEWVDFPDEVNDGYAKLKFTCAINSGLRSDDGEYMPHLLFRSLGKAGIRVIRYGQYFQPVQEFQAAFPVTYVRQSAPVNGLRPGCFFLGFMRSQDARDLQMRPVNKCTVRACIFPVNGNGKGLCHTHGHFFDYASSMNGRLDRSDLFADHEHRQPHANFTTGWLWEEKTNYLRTTFLVRGQSNPGERASSDWWKQNVIGEQPKPLGGLHHGVGGLHHGKRKKKRPGKRSQRAKRKLALENRNGHAHPSKKPREKFEREAIADIPIWTPPAQEPDEYSEPIFTAELETAVDDDEYEREQAMAQLSSLQGEFEEAFGGSE